jgi:FKBP-type peptidyl-prolyl cis-trans isomerase
MDVRMKLFWSIPLVALTAWSMAHAGGDAAKKEKVVEVIIETADGKFTLKYIDLVEGKGKEVKKRNTIEVHYTGWLADGTKFDSSRDRDERFVAKIGVGTVIKGWDEGVPGMKEGGKRKLIIPAGLAYGKNGVGNVIPPNAELIFEVEVFRVK